MPKKKLISVVMAAYNGEAFIREQINSILNQTYENFELIIIDDGSDDSTLKIINDYRNLPNVFIKENNENLGLIRTFERGLQMASGNFIALADQDDLWEPHKLEVLHSSIGSKGLAYSNAQIIDQTGCATGERISEKLIFHGISSDNELVFEAVLFQGVSLGCTMLLSRGVAFQAGHIPIVSKNHDWFISLVALRNGGITYVDEILMSYRHHNTNTSRRYPAMSASGIIFGFFSKKAKTYRHERHRLVAKDLLELINRKERLGFDEKQIELINNYHAYAMTCVSGTKRFQRVAFAMRYRALLFPYFNKYLRFLHALSRGI